MASSSNCGGSSGETRSSSLRRSYVSLQPAIVGSSLDCILRIAWSTVRDRFSGRRELPQTKASLPLRRESVRRQRVVISILMPPRREEDEVGVLARSQPGEPSALVKPTKREAPYRRRDRANPMRGFERLTAH